MNKHDVLTQSVSDRENEIFFYQINIDNYSLALAEIDALEEIEQSQLSMFRQQLTDLLASEQLEQKKAKIMLKVLKYQLEA